MKRLILALPVIALALVTTISTAQKIDIKLRQSFESEDTKPEPATITYTKPKNEKGSYLADIALGLEFGLGPRNTLSAYGEYHRNTLTDDEVNTFQTGFAYELHTNKNFASPGGTKKKNGSTIIIKANGKYSNNEIKEIRSMQITGELTGLWAPGYFPNCFLPNVWNQLGDGFAIEYFPSIGFEFENRFKTENKADKGTITRVMGKLYTSLYPFSKIANNSIEIFANTAFRYDFINTTELTDLTHPSIETGVNIILFKDAKKKISIGASYNNIDDPALGKEAQNFWLIALKAKI